jgi:O-antigen ligase
MWPLSARGPRASVLAHAATAVALMAPTLWLSWVAPRARELVLPTLVFLALALRWAWEGGSRADRLQPWTRAFGAGTWDPLRGWQTCLTLPVLLSLIWVCVETCGSGLRTGPTALPGAIDFARAELLRCLAGTALYLTLLRACRNWPATRRIVDYLLWAVLCAMAAALVARTGETPTLRGAFGNQQLFAAFLLQIAPLAVAVGLTSRRPHRRLVAQIAAVLALTGLALTQTRSAWIGAVVAMAVLAALLMQLPRRRGRRPDLRPALAAGALALCGLGWVLCQTDLAGPLLARAATLGRLSEDTGMTWRLRQWRLAWSLIQEQPLTGHGPGSFSLVSAPRLSPPIPLELVRATGPNLSLNAHNLCLQTLAETGAIGLGLHLWLWIAFFRAGHRALHRLAEQSRPSRRRGNPGVETEETNRSRSLRMQARGRFVVLAACMAAAAGGAVDGLANPAYQYLDVQLFVWAVLGLGAAMTRPVDRGDWPASQAAEEAAGIGWALGLLPYPLRLAAAVAGAGALIAGSVAGSQLPVSQAEYLPFRSLRVTALTSPGYLTQTLLPGECVELRAFGALESGVEQEATAQCHFSRGGGSAPADCLQQLAPPHANLFCLPAGVPAAYDGLTVALQGTLDFNGQTLTSVSPPLTVSVPRACPGVRLTAEPQVLPPTGDPVEVQVHYEAPGLRLQRLLRVQANEPLRPDDVLIVTDTQVRLRAVSVEPGHRIYSLYYRFLDHRGSAWVAPVQIFVR